MDVHHETKQGMSVQFKVVLSSNMAFDQCAMQGSRPLIFLCQHRAASVRIAYIPEGSKPTALKQGLQLRVDRKAPIVGMAAHPSRRSCSRLYGGVGLPVCTLHSDTGAWWLTSPSNTAPLRRCATDGGLWRRHTVWMHRQWQDSHVCLECAAG
jgi:hypothetical protein